MTYKDETPIGDGVTVSCDGFHVWLRTDRGIIHEVALEPSTLQALDEWRRKLAAEYNAPQYAPVAE